MKKKQGQQQGDDSPQSGRGLGSTGEETHQPCTELQPQLGLAQVGSAFFFSSPAKGIFAGAVMLCWRASVGSYFNKHSLPAAF